jgi:hypothetical protein
MPEQWPQQIGCLFLVPDDANDSAECLQMGMSQTLGDVDL